MTPLEIVLILIGAGIIIISFFLVDKSSVKEDTFILTDNEHYKHDLTDEEIAEIKRKIDTAISDVSEETVIKAEDQLNKISNEKIIAVNDFSSQILEKIDQNHKEVVFLYTMLNEKESELKDTMKQVELSKKQLVDEDMNNLRNTNQKVSTQILKENQFNAGLTGIDQSVQNSINLLDDIGDNNNKRILDLYSQGNTIIEISKLLGLGQGEVKLVIDLFKQK